MNVPDFSKEKEFLDSLVMDYTDESPYSRAKKDVIHGLCKEYIKYGSKKRVLQLGCSNGYETSFLSDNFKKVDVIDGSEKFINKIKTQTMNRKNIEYVFSLFEEFGSSENRYDYIFCNYVLEHVIDAKYVLQNIRKSLDENGLLFAVVPNAQAFSRRLAMKMGLITDLYGIALL
jgi:2-polyprenyl-3-methyl-5-hydroxy-6-metoxy-1,4-benzoquinol methylase